LTALNLFTTKFDQVLELVEKRAETVKFVVAVGLPELLSH
jgi:GPN-loop GTPase